ncbi:MAG TPA: TetR/AcrR family transcriptional regulator [Solirubrobacterales bacterium]|nr:TetR/AcrR family transcriptional regulator [Solirubrobacterales bacterium]
MLQTPWGDADTLRERRLPPGRSGDRDAARRDQRERLFAALVASCDEKGYDATSVEDLLRTSGVSRATFYEQFDDKLACFRAAQDEMLAAGIAVIADQLRTDGDPDDRPRAALEAFVDLIVQQPAAARMCLVGSYASGTTGIDQIQGAIDRIIRLVRDAAEQMSDRSAMPAELLRGIIGGLYQVIYGRLRERREAELPDLVPGLWNWVMSFPPPPRPLRRAGRLIVARPIPTAPPFASYSAEQRIIRGFAVAVAAKGYPATTIADIAAAASISQTTFYEHFDGKAEALRAALDSSGAQVLAAVMPAVKRTATWKVAVRVGFEELCGFLASEPSFASLRCVDVYGAGPEAITARDGAGMRLVADLVKPAYRDGLKASQLELEASAGAVYGILFEGVRSGHTADLPRLAPFLTYFALAPFIGAEEACDTANGRGRAGSAG